MAKGKSTPAQTFARIFATWVARRDTAKLTEETGEKGELRPHRRGQLCAPSPCGLGRCVARQVDPALAILQITDKNVRPRPAVSWERVEDLTS